MPFFRVEQHHEGFVRMLMGLGMSLAAVPVQHLGEQRLYLGVRCHNAVQAKRHTIEIVRELLIVRPELLPGLDLGTWKARKLSNRLCLFWTGVEIERVLLH
jgi:hypothetical protein